jgi:hypothetical protein
MPATARAAVAATAQEFSREDHQSPLKIIVAAGDERAGGRSVGKIGSPFKAPRIFFLHEP